MKSDFFQVPAPGKTRGITWNEQKADAVMGSFGTRGADRNNEKLGQLSVTDEDLGPIDDVLSIFQHRPGFDASEVGSVTGFGHGQGKDGLSTLASRNPAVELRWVTELLKVGENDVVVERDEKPGCPIIS